MNIKLLANPTSGNNQGQRLLKQQLEIRSAATQPKDIKQQLETFLDDNDCLIIAGGDGTIHLILNGLCQTPFCQTVSLALLPLGTGNDLATALNIPKHNLPALVAHLKQKPNTLELPLWYFNNTVFSNYLSWGIDAKTVYDVDRWRKNLPSSRLVNKLLYVSSAVYNFFKLRCKNFTINDTTEKLFAVVVVNINSYAAGSNLVNHTINAEKKCYLIKIKSRYAYFKLIAKRLFKKIDLQPEALDLLSIQTDCDWLQIDGEVHKTTSGEIKFANTVTFHT